MGLGEQAAAQYDRRIALAHVVAADVLILWGIFLGMLTSRHMLWDMTERIQRNYIVRSEILKEISALEVVKKSEIN